MAGCDASDLAIGINVDIERTDGRIHSAIISGVNRDRNVVTVEWYERGEAKGKEIDMAAIFRLNPSLRSHDSTADNAALLKDRLTNETVLTNPPQRKAVPQDSSGTTSGIPSAQIGTAATQVCGPRPYRQGAASRLPAPSTRITRARANAAGSSNLFNQQQEELDSQQQQLGTEDICEF
ncbi:unnamed protein product [Rodentolepis nana]|uniref:Kinesin motor domain-containing protein n=1 Tax=Rodentolepis nana TaxID=102285 RepID=A0A0R3T325_RODNA|nr:unnamed protein product [Rodentolepis nana]